MLVRPLYFISKSAILATLIAFGLSGCWTGADNLLDDEPSVEISSLLDEGRHVFVQRSDDDIALLIIEVSPHETRFAYQSEERWSTVSDVKKITVEDDTAMIAIIDRGGGGLTEYQPFVFFDEGVAIHISGGASVTSKEEMAEQLHASVSGDEIVDWMVFKAVAGEDVEPVLREFRAYLERKARETEQKREESARARQEQQEQQQRARQERERQERERLERERELAAAFRSDGYALPDLMEAIYAGNTRGLKSDNYGLYLHTFAQMFYHAEGDRACNTAVTFPAVSALALSATLNTLGTFLGPLFEAHRRGSTGRDEAFTDGAEAGVRGGLSAVQAELSGRNDARLFYSRHGCASPAAIRFFTNFNRFVLQN